jgi:hypothetical protein
MAFWLFLVGGLMGRFGHDGTVSNVTTWVIENNKPASHAVTACSFLFVASFATSWVHLFYFYVRQFQGPVSWTYPPEIFAANIRAKAVAFSTATNWAFKFALAYAVPPMLEHIQYKTYFVFGTFNAFAAIMMFLFAHETKRRYNTIEIN